MASDYSQERRPVYRRTLGSFALDWLDDVAAENGGGCGLFQDALERARATAGGVAIYLSVDALPALPFAAVSELTPAQSVARTLERLDAAARIFPRDKGELTLRLMRAHLRSQRSNVVLACVDGPPSGPLGSEQSRASRLVPVWTGHPYWVYDGWWYPVGHNGLTDQQLSQIAESTCFPFGTFWVTRKPSTAVLPEERHVSELIAEEAAYLTDSLVAIYAECCDASGLLEWLAPGAAPPVYDGEILA
ncbi:MAG: hypothetical protein KGJ62_03195 [Armatimonadetes bacterium]|nr:hypothetical protein [Armatimonadota bacterium]